MINTLYRSFLFLAILWQLIYLYIHHFIVTIRNSQEGVHCIVVPMSAVIQLDAPGKSFKYCYQQ